MKSTFLKSTVTLVPLLISGGAHAQSNSVTVVPGDTLAGIAKIHLGDGSHWRKLCNLNREVVGENCDDIKPGMILKMPDGTTFATAKVEPAENRIEESFAVDMVSEKGTVFIGQAPLKATRADNAGFVTLRGSAENVSPSGKPGLHIQVSPGFEKSASGKKIRITIDLIAKADGEIFASYSTNEVGNSGWRSLKVKPGENTVSFEYAVPAVKAGNGDYLGILPDPNSTGQTVDIKSIKIDVKR